MKHDSTVNGAVYSRTSRILSVGRRHARPGHGDRAQIGPAMEHDASVSGALFSRTIAASRRGPLIGRWACGTRDRGVKPAMSTMSRSVALLSRTGAHPVVVGRRHAAAVGRGDRGESARR
jgi:hypothetical protein